MSTIPTRTGGELTIPLTTWRVAKVGGPQPSSTANDALFVVPRGRGDGFQASIRGHILDLADPGSDRPLAPTPNDLLIVSLASELAWAAWTFLRRAGLPDDVSVSAEWRTQDDPPRPAGIDLTIRVSRRTDALAAALTAAFEDSLAARSLAEPIVRVSVDEAW